MVRMLENSHLLLWLYVALTAWIVSAQSASSVTSFQSISTPASSSKAAQTHTINVGKGNHQYSPEVVQAAVNDVIEFQFFTPNHSVARAEYEYPCIPYELTGANKVGFFSGFHPVDAILDNPPTWNLTINDTEPIFIYCSAPGSCINYAMVGVINPNASVSLATQKKDAKNAAYMLVPGEELPTGEVLPSQTGASLSASATGSATVTMPPSSSQSSTAAAASTPSDNVAHGHSKLSEGAIAGIAIGAIVLAAGIGFLLFLLGRHRTELQFLRRDVHTQSQRPPPPEMKPSYSSVHRPLSPGFPYDSEDPRFHEQQAYDVPPYPKEVPGSPPLTTAELPSPPLGADISRAGSPASELDTRRHTRSPPPRSLMESIGPGFGPGGIEGAGQRY